MSDVNEKSESTFLISDDVVFVAEFQPDEASLYEERYRLLAEQYRDRFSFAIRAPSRRQSSIICRNNVDDEKYTLSELSLVGALEELILRCATPLIPELSRKDIAEIGQVASQNGKSIIVHYFAASEQEKELYRKEMRRLAKKYSKDLQFVIVDPKQHPTMPAMVGLRGDTETGLSIENLSNGDLFPYSGKTEISAVALEHFLNEIVEGHVAPWDGSSVQQVLHDEL